MTSRSSGRSLLLLTVLSVAAPASLAMTLGPVEGVPLIGRPLDVTIRVLLDPGADIASLCARADVTQGDSQTSGVITRVESISAQQAVIRVRTSRPIEEPVVTIVAHAGCTMPMTRRFVMLADLPAEQQQSIQLPAANAPIGAPAVAVRSGQAREGQPAVQQSQSGAVRGSRLPARERTGPATSQVRRAETGAAVLRPEQVGPAPAASSGTAESKPATAGTASIRKPSVVLKQQRPVAGAAVASRLRLDPIDLTVDADPNLKLTQTIERLISVSPGQRADASAALRAMTMPPEEFQKLLALDTELKSLRLQVQSSTAEIASLQLQLKAAEADRTSMIWGLSALSLALLAGLLVALFWRRREAKREDNPLWWDDVKVLPGDDPVLVDIDRAMQKPKRVVPDEGPESSLDVDLTDFNPFTAEKQAPRKDAAPEALSSFNHLDFQSSQASGWRSMKSEELSDLQEQAEFFVSLGDYDRAVNVLMAHVQASPQTSALAWMALLDLHHRLQRRQGYDGLREQIQRRMNVIVPEFDAYRDDTAGLESYPEAIGRITTLWPSRRVLDVLDEYVYLMPGTAAGQPFEMAAFHDLLMLHDLAKAVADNSELDEIDLDAPPSQGDEFPMTNISPLSAELQGPSDEDFQLFATLLAGGRIDVNLEDAPAPLDAGAAATTATQPGNLVDFDDFDAATARVSPSRKNSAPR